MKFRYITIILAFAPFYAFAEGENVVTSRAYVLDKLDSKQDNIGGGTNGTLITNSGTAGQVGTPKAVYKTGSGNTYSNQTTSLIEAGQANSAIQNGLNSHVTCYDSQNGDCVLWQINALSGTYIPE